MNQARENDEHRFVSFDATVMDICGLKTKLTNVTRGKTLTHLLSTSHLRSADGTNDPYSWKVTQYLLHK